VNRHADKAMFVDTHTHIHDESDRAKSAAEIFAHAHEQGVERIITIGTRPEDSLNARDFAEEWSKKGEKIYWTYGYHPNEYAEKDHNRLTNDLNMASEAIKSPQNVGIGEIGLDYHFDGYSPERQRELLLQMLQLAQDYQKPVSFHIRDAFEDFWPIFDNFKLPTSVLHSFSDSKKNLNEGLKRGLFIGVNGLSTFADIAHPPLERVVLETDAPYLTPKPFRGTMNMPGYVRNIADWAAEYYQVDLGTVANITTKNAQNIFKI
jgi:TatD DNase family protein